MGNALANLSNIIIPALIFYVVGYGIIHHTNVYDDFIDVYKRQYLFCGRFSEVCRQLRPVSMRGTDFYNAGSKEFI